MSSESIVVVGAGITGVSAAEWLRRDGWVVTLVDPVRPGDPEQTSYGNAGLIARTSVVPVATPSLTRKAPAMLLDPNSPLFLRWSYLPRLMPWLVPFLRNTTTARMHQIARGLSDVTFDANDQHRALYEGTGAEAHVAHGPYTILYTDRGAYDGDNLTRELRRQYDLVPEPLSRDELIERDPNLSAHYQFGTLYEDFNWITAPGPYVAALFAYFQAQGGTFRQAKVVDITPGDAPSVRLEGGEMLTGDKVVLAAGAWSSRLSKSLGLPIKLEAERGYHVAMHAPSFTAPQPYMLTDAKCVVTPMQGTLRAAGIAEFGGLHAPPSDKPPALIRKAVKRLYPQLEFERSEVWMGRRPTTPDSLPSIGESPRAPGIIHAYGGQHIGLTIGPKLGRLSADIASGRRVNLDLTPFRPDRF
ncbi:FAD-binding oxidoreductase [Ruegeria sp. HKCCD8929]|uniref:NAD(P)/FAD-dependent oxidoreductase n=1 Tax=Ruegeria sp. HKCCD8929 TaxID=2683006 RepID=UPI0014890AF0|nr:FAD-binding oxidoreductase [Ruegeria sp. HKCCD8929]